MQTDTHSVLNRQFLIITAVYKRILILTTICKHPHCNGGTQIDPYFKVSTKTDYRCNGSIQRDRRRNGGIKTDPHFNDDIKTDHCKFFIFIVCILLRKYN
jgi:hypothetical protein